MIYVVDIIGKSGLAEHLYPALAEEIVYIPEQGFSMRFFTNDSKLKCFSRGIRQ